MSPTASRQAKLTPIVSNLQFFVMCKSTLRFFETIAGFDFGPAAFAYMDECAARNPGFEYKVVEG